MRQKKRAPYGSRFAYLAMFGTFLVGCSGEGEVVRGESGGVDSKSTDVEPRSPALPTPSAASKPRISTEQVVLTLDAVPSELEGVDLGDAAWLAWFQEALGSSVEVTSAGLLHRGQGADSGNVAAPGSVVVVGVTASDEPLVRAAVARAAAAPQVMRAEADPIWTSDATPNDPRYFQQAHLPQIRASQAWDQTSGSPSVIVAVLDSGLDVAHEDLAAAVWTNDDPVDGVDNDGNGFVDDLHGWNFVNTNRDLTDTSGHGTHVAGIIGATANNGLGVAGVAHGVRVMPVKVGGPAVTASAVAQAIYYAVDNGARVINMSFGGPETFSGARAAVDYARERGVSLVGSAGNNASEEYNYPAIYQDIVAVAALDGSNARAALSNYGAWVDVAAPGLDVLSTFPGNGYVTGSGTSQAAPIVSGVLALIRSAHPAWSAEQARAQLLATARDVSAQNPEYVGLLGAGIVDASAAVGAAVTAPRAYLAGVRVTEATGNGDQEVGVGETANVEVSLHFTSGSGTSSAVLSSNDPWITVTSGSSSVSATTDRVSLAKFQVQVSPNAPVDHTAALKVQIAGASLELPVQISVARSFHHVRLPFAFDQRLSTLPGGGEVLVADDASRGGTQTTGGAPDFVYATFRNADGSFTPKVVLSADKTLNARRPRAVVAPNGDIHVVFFQSVQRLDFAAFPAYTRYDAATRTWQPSTLFTSAPGIFGGNDDCVAITLDTSGDVHVAYANVNGVVTMRLASGVWQTPVVHPLSLPTGVPEAHVTFVETSTGLRLFAHPVSASLGSPAVYTPPTTVLDYDPSAKTWSSPVVVTSVVTDEIGQAPFVFDDSTWRLYQAPSSSLASLAELDGSSWRAAGTVRDLAGADFRRGYFAVRQSETAYLSFLARPAAGTNGSVRELGDGDTTRVLPGDPKRRAIFPRIDEDSSGRLHVFNREVNVRRVAEGVYTELGASSSYYTAAPLAVSARPTLPVVTDAGATTTNGQQIVASWSSAHATGIAAYRVAVGTIPGGDDLVPWQETTSTGATLSLGDQRLVPGQAVYVSVEARANGLLTSAVGVSDGITYVTTAPSCVPVGCETAPTVSVPYAFNGPSTNACVFLTGPNSHVNSWESTLVELNGTAVTNQWKAASSFPATCNGGYYLKTSGKFPWSHVEVQ